MEIIFTSLESIAGDRKLKEKDFGDQLIPIISLDALEREKELSDEGAMIFVGKIFDREKIKERLLQLETVFAKEYEKERVLKQDYNFVQMFLQQRADYEPKQESYDALKLQWKQLQRERDEVTAKVRMLGEQEEALRLEAETLDKAFKEAKNHRQICSL